MELVGILQAVLVTASDFNHEGTVGEGREPEEEGVFSSFLTHPFSRLGWPE